MKRFFKFIGKIILVGFVCSLLGALIGGKDQETGEMLGEYITTGVFLIWFISSLLKKQKKFRTEVKAEKNDETNKIEFKLAEKDLDNISKVTAKSSLPFEQCKLAYYEAEGDLDKFSSLVDQREKAFKDAKFHRIGTEIIYWILLSFVFWILFWIFLTV